MNFAQFMVMVKVKHLATMQVEIWEKNWTNLPPYNFVEQPNHMYHKVWTTGY